MCCYSNKSMESEEIISYQDADTSNQDTPEVTPLVQSSKLPILRVLVIVLLSIVVIGVLSRTYIGLSNRSQNNKNEENKVTEVVSTEQPTPTTQATKTPEKLAEVGNIFTNLPNELQKTERTVELTPTAGFLIINSILSNLQNRIVYSEITDCIRQVNDYGKDPQGCEWEYRVYVKTISTGESKLLFRYPEPLETGLKQMVKKVSAGGCPLVNLPIAWTGNDQKIILQSVNPTDCGSGGGDNYLFSAISSEGGEAVGFSKSQAVFYERNSKAIFTTASQLSPLVCGPGGEQNQGKIVFWDINGNRLLESIEVPNSDYYLGELLLDRSMIEYFRRTAFEKNGCAEIDYSTQGERLVSSLP